MKTGMEGILAGLFALLLAVLGWNAYSMARVDMAVARVNAMALGHDLPPEALGLAKLGTGWIVSAAVGGVLAGLGATLAYKAWPLIKKRMKNDDRRKWVAGPNANYGRERGPKIPTESELMRTMMLRQMMPQGSQMPRLEVHDEDEPVIRL